KLEEDGEYVTGTVTMGASGVTLYGVWVECDKYALSYKWKGEAPDPAKASLPLVTDTYYAGEKYTVHKGYDTIDDGTYIWTFHGWKLNGEGNNLSDTEQTMVVGGAKYIGEWTKTASLTSLTIEKKLSIDKELDTDAVYLFKVSGGGLENDLTVAVKANESVTIEGLKVGATYTVTEITDWSWRWIKTWIDGQSGDTVEMPLVADPEANTVTFTNSISNNWLFDDAYAKNVFNGNVVADPSENQ
ncbi:MAG: hypothetical protein IIY02_05500, partial [Firmicutes bacterium]|nr:hypothetical protein [Bacillota bacterium]